MHPIDRFEQPGVIVAGVLFVLALVGDWTRARLARIAVDEADAAEWRARGAWLDGVWADVEAAR